MSTSSDDEARFWDWGCGFWAWAILNETEEPFRHFHGWWGPHGSTRPGNYMVMDTAGFCIEVTPEQFASRYTTYGPFHVG